MLCKELGALDIVPEGCAALLFDVAPKENFGAVDDAPCVALALAGVAPNANEPFAGSGALVSANPDEVPVPPNMLGVAVVPKENAGFGGAPAGVVLTFEPKLNADFGGGPAGVVVAAVLLNRAVVPGVPAGVVLMLMGDAVLFAGVWGSAGFAPNIDPLGVPAGVVDAPNSVAFAVWFAGVEGKAVCPKADFG